MAPGSNINMNTFEEFKTKRGLLTFILSCELFCMSIGLVDVLFKCFANITDNKAWWYLWWLVSFMIFVFNLVFVALTLRFVKAFNIKHMVRCMIVTFILFAVRIA